MARLDEPTAMTTARNNGDRLLVGNAFEIMQGFVESAQVAVVIYEINVGNRWSKFASRQIRML